MDTYPNHFMKRASFGFHFITRTSPRSDFLAYYGRSQHTNTSGLLYIVSMDRSLHNSFIFPMQIKVYAILKNVEICVKRFIGVNPGKGLEGVSSVQFIFSPPTIFYCSGVKFVKFGGSSSPYFEEKIAAFRPVDPFFCSSFFVIAFFFSKIN